MSNKFDALKISDESGDDESQAKNNLKTDKDEVVAPEINPNEHKLQYAYALWYSRRNPGKQNSIQSYDRNLKLVGRFASVEQFWGLYSHLTRPSELTTHTDFHLFKIGIKPMWEDEANQRGGKWIVRLRKGLVSRCWENLILAMLGEQFMVGEEICGAVVSIRFQEQLIESEIHYDVSYIFHPLLQWSTRHIMKVSKTLQDREDGKIELLEAKLQEELK
ncbi:hypothetical protein TSAR_004180 [Trichomalopsis sarcophagae]|uniref:eIF-4F 25 kDa subunit n=1 Tax=Trichomalopsis sarcophagae TaxID=543379 RepID=A0A232FH71_9HYME|nr:hypothetical protein TSAR_004180 [Trichomalopsis sarcophagae]